MNERELKEEIRRNIQDMYMHENDAQYIEDVEMAALDDTSETYEEEMEQLESYISQEQNAAYQLQHVIQCDLAELNDLTGMQYTMEDFTDTE